MLALTHSVAGSIAGDFFELPVFSFLIGIILHFVFDKVPHFWPKKDKYQLILLGIDWFLASLYIIWLFLQANHFGWGAFWGAFGGFFVDIVLITGGLIKKNKISTWHSNRQPHKTSPVFFLTDIIFLIVLAAIFWSIV